MERTSIKGERLTTWAVTACGKRADLGFEDDSGRPCTISLPVGLLSALMMTIPRMLHQALHAQLPDGSLRMIHRLGEWKVERAANADASILRLTTEDGFEVTFAVDTAEASRLAEMLSYSAQPGAISAQAVN